MRIVLDNCVDVRAAGLFVGHEIVHARDLEWRQLTNGELIARAAKQFDILATTDKKMRHEHDLAKLPISILELNTHFTRLVDLKTLEPHLGKAIEACSEFRFVSVKPDGAIETLGPSARP